MAIKINESLMQDLAAIPYLQNEILGILKNIEVNIPEDSRQNFYTNLQSLRINTSANDLEEGMLAAYDIANNQILISNNYIELLIKSCAVQEIEQAKEALIETLYHELLHMASATRNEKTRYYTSGLVQKHYENGELLYEEDLNGMTEGVTELLTTIAFGGNRNYASYTKQTNTVYAIVQTVGLEAVKKAYFNNRDGMKPIDEELQKIDGNFYYSLLYEEIEYQYRQEYGTELDWEENKKGENMENIKTITISDLRKKGIYDPELLQSLQEGKYQKLYDVPMSDRANRDFMEPLLYAVKNEMGTYAVYAYYAENLQEDTVLASEIIQAEPQLIEGTPISQNKEFIMAHVSSNPDIIEYISPTLKSDIDIIQEVYQTGNANAIEALAQEGAKIETIETILSNPELSNDREFMTAAIEKSGDAIALASAELKDNYEFLREAYKVNIEAVDYTAEHTEEFGEKGLTAAKDAIAEHYCDKAIQEWTEAIEVIEQQLAELRENNLPENVDRIKTLEMDAKRFKRHIRFAEQIKSGEKNPSRAAELISGMCAKIPPEYKKATGQMIKIDTAMKQRKKDAEKQITTEEIGDTARNFEEMEGKTPQSEFQELKDAIIEPIHEEEQKGDERE